MKGFPELNTEDVLQLDALLKDFVARSGALAALMVESAGYLIHHVGQLPGEPREFASLAANAFSAAQEMSKRLGESYFTLLRVSGTGCQTLVRRVDETCLLVVVFKSDLDAKRIEDEALPPVIGIYERLEIARHRAPGATVDFADADADNVTKFFKRRPPAS